MKKLIAFSLLFAALHTHAQDATIKNLSSQAARGINKNVADTVQKPWRKGGLFSANIAQGSLSNWAAGGDDYSLSVNSLISLFAFYKNGKHAWDNTLDFNYGLIRTTTLGSRKNDDRFDLLSKYGYAIAPKWNVATLFNFRTQFFKGYQYDAANKRTLVSDFLAPAYVLLGLGLDYKPNSNFSVYMSPITARWIIVHNDSLSAKGLYGVDPGKKSKLEVGAYVSANYLKTFNKVLAYKGRLDLFSNYRHNPQNIDLYMTNILSIKFTKALSATWNVDFIYDDDAKLFGKNKRSPALQIKSLIGIGLLMKFGNAKA